MQIYGYIIRRLLLFVPVLIGTVTLTFLILQIPAANPAAAAIGSNDASPQAIAAYKAYLGLSDPLWLQYVHYVEGIFTGRWGISFYTQQPVYSLFWTFFPATLELGLVAVLIMIPVGLILGLYSGVHENSTSDHLTRFFSVLGLSLPAFWLALLVQLLFGVQLHVLPLAGRLSIALSPPVHITGLYLLDSLLTRNWATFADALVHIIAPAFVLAFTSIGVIIRLVRSLTLETKKQDYVKTAKSKGLTGWALNYPHVLRPVMVQSGTVVALASGRIILGSFLVETIFNWPGLSWWASQSLVNFDYPVIMAVAIFYTFVFLTINLATDVLYFYFDPRIKF